MTTDSHVASYKLAGPCVCDPVRVERVCNHINKRTHLESSKGRAAAVVSSVQRLPATHPGTTTAIESGLDGDGGVARAVESQGLSVAGQG